MPLEIERKFLIKDNSWREQVSKSTDYIQGYLSNDGIKAIRVRVAGDKAYTTIKAVINNNLATRLEYEYEIPVDDAREMLEKLCTEGKVEKTRHLVKLDNLIWEIDEFKGDNQGLLLAEVELEDEKKELLLPDWVGEEVTSDVRYLNSELAKKPFSKF